MSMGISTQAHADAVTMWNNQLLTIIQETSSALVDGPPEVAREMAMVDTAMYNAAAAAAAHGADQNAAALAAGYSAMMALYSPANTTGNPNTGNTTTIGNLWSSSLTTTMQLQINGAYTSALASLDTSDYAVSTGLSTGVTAATAQLVSQIGSVTANSDSDGSYASIKSGLVATNYSPAAGQLAPGANADSTGVAGTDVGVGVYVQPTRGPAGMTGAMYPTWGTVTPYAATTATIQGIATSVTPLNLQSAAYANDLMQTYCTGGTGGATQTTVCTAYATATGANISNSGLIGGVDPTQNALYWNDPGTTEQPPGHWLAILNTIIADYAAAGNPLTLLQEAQLSMLLSQAEDDAAIAAWSAKYDWSLWRPITAITTTNPDGSCKYGDWNQTLADYGFTCDSSWTSVIATPPHPDFVAGHPAFSAAASTVLANFFGTDTPGFSFSNSSNGYCNAPGYIVTVLGDASHTEVWPTLDPLVDTTQYTCWNASTATANVGLYIAPITETFANFTDASNAATDSRVSGGIHTPTAVNDANAIGVQIGTLVANQTINPIPEPASMLVVGCGIVALGAMRRRRQAPCG